MAPSSSTSGPAFHRQKASGSTHRTPIEPATQFSRSLRSSAVPSAPKSNSIKTPSKTLGISLNLSEHSRADPVGALRVLLKLLTSLPSRVGGCQYKLTPAEQALAVHLVGVVDPFVCHGARALSVSNSMGVTGQGFGDISFASLPTELIDLILGHVDAQKDLLHLGLVSKRLHDIVFPQHFEYRVIKCKASSVKIWKHLITHSVLARNVRKVEILDERERNGRIIVPRLLKAKVGSVAASRGGGGFDTVSSSGSSSSDEHNSKKLNIHLKHERLLSRTLLHLSNLKEFKWSCNHSPISISTIWSSLMNGPGKGLQVLDVSDNMLFHPGHSWNSESENDTEESESDFEKTGSLLSKGFALHEMSSVVFRSTPHTYGAAKNPELRRIGRMLHQCGALKNLEISYISPRSSVTTPNGQGVPMNGNTNINTRTRPLADQLLMYTRFGSNVISVTSTTWTFSPSLTSLTLTNLRLTCPLPLTKFLSVHTALEQLSLVDVHLGSMNQANGWFRLPLGCLPRLREVRASKEVINAVLECPISDEDMKSDFHVDLLPVARTEHAPNWRVHRQEKSRPLQIVKGFKLSGPHSPTSSNNSRTIPDSVFLANLKAHASDVSQVELASWHDMDDIRKLAAVLPHLEVLDVGKRVGPHNATGAGAAVANITEWTDVLSTMPELKELRGVRFFYDVSSPPTGSSHSNARSSVVSTPSAMHPMLNVTTSTSITGGPSPSPHTPLPTHIKLSATDRSRLRKNEEIAGLLAWKCKGLRKVDWWDEGRVVVLVRDREGDNLKKARWEVRKA